jgi:hypothetical protein
MKKIIGFAIAGVLLYGCSNSTPKTESTEKVAQKNIEIANDMENAAGLIPSWASEKSVIAMKQPAAHSGQFACVTNDTIEYSYTYGELFKNINSVLPKKVYVNGWVYTTVAKPNFAIILDVNQDNKSYDWKAYPLNNDLTETGKWIEFNASFYFDKPLNLDQQVKIYAWNQTKKPIYIDDLKISFEY